MTHSKYHHLTYESRIKIYTLLNQGFSLRMIAKEVGYHASTISKEIHRNKGKRGYRYKQAQRLALNRRKKASKKRKKMTLEMVSIVESKMRHYQWSPEQIAGWLKKHKQIFISHESIYKHVWKDKKDGGDLYKNMRHQGKKYNKRNGKNSGRGLIPDRVDIDQRPTIVEEKIRIGDWEGDTIIGKNHTGALVTWVDRVSKYVKMELIKKKTADSIEKATSNLLKPVKELVFTLTTDNGKEFANHKNIAANLNAPVYFAKPYHSWERGLNEHTNGLIRQYFPKKTNFDTISQEDVQRVENLLNSRPRKILKFCTPFEVFSRAKLGLSNVALQS